MKNISTAITLLVRHKYLLTFMGLAITIMMSDFFFISYPSIHINWQLTRAAVNATAVSNTITPNSNSDVITTTSPKSSIHAIEIENAIAKPNEANAQTIIVEQVAKEGVKNSKKNIDKEKKITCSQKSGDATKLTGVAINLGFIINGLPQDRKQELFAAFNSLFYFRTCPLNFRLAIDSQTQDVFDEYLNRTRSEAPELLKGVSFISYDTDPAINATADLHTSWPFRAALYKTSPEVIFTDVSEIMILDFDVVFVGDICPHYERHVKQIREAPDAIMGMAPEFVNIYNPDLSTHNFRDEATSAFGFAPNKTSELYRWGGDRWSGFNAGIYVCHLERMRKRQWTPYWVHLLTEERWSSMSKIILKYPEQNIFVLACRLNPSWFLSFTPTLNFQLGHWAWKNLGNEILEKHYDEVVIIHGNNKAYQKATTFSELWYLFANHDVSRFHSNVRPDNFYDAQKVCDERLNVTSYVLVGARAKK